MFFHHFNTNQKVKLSEYIKKNINNFKIIYHSAGYMTFPDQVIDSILKKEKNGEKLDNIEISMLSAIAMAETQLMDNMLISEHDIIEYSNIFKQVLKINNLSGYFEPNLLLLTKSFGVVGFSFGESTHEENLLFNSKDKDEDIIKKVKKYRKKESDNEIEVFVTDKTVYFIKPLAKLYWLPIFSLLDAKSFLATILSNKFLFDKFHKKGS